MHLFFFFFQTIISLTFLCIVPSTWKNIGGVQEKLGIDLAFRVDKSLLCFASVLKPKELFLFFIFCQWQPVGELLLRKPQLMMLMPDLFTLRIQIRPVSVLQRQNWWGCGGVGGVRVGGACLWMMLLVFGGLESFTSHGFGGWTDSSWVDSLL